ncbi:LysR family transcriptional regulator [Ignatzschineria rhizosphaerae]|uniref:LysR family transcriptional regulator n=1 Tax=Ignatzschineria rhizosphaerae TaxID=2923279 RepID=A0ABY3X1P1_9GAMM|nr:LysR family transcriptional regulator [Ignatzschineria rhizosphaerae]UNM95372.1 LysR family transcriptional regulator [Ignatzschineria rhizosphaerae]
MGNNDKIINPSSRDNRLNERLDWNLLRTYLVIVQERSISVAGIKLHLTQSAVSQALKRLEDHFGKRLIERHGTKFSMTAAGLKVQKAAENIYGNISELISEVSQSKEEAVGKVRLLCASRIHSMVYDEFWGEFHRMHPRIEIQIEVLPSRDIVNLLQQRTATAGIALCRKIPSKIESKVFLTQRYALFCGKKHHYFGKEDCQIEDLINENFVSFTSDALGDSLSPLTIFRDQKGFSGNIVATSTHHDEVKRLLVAGLGIGCLPEHSVQQYVSEGLLWRLPPEEGVCTTELHFLWHKDAYRSSAETIFIEAFIEYMEKYSLSQRLLTKLI